MPDKLVGASSAYPDDIQGERAQYAALVRAARAALGWSQSKLAERAGVGLRSVIRLERGESDTRRSTAVAVEQVFKAEGLVIEVLPEGGFRLTVPRMSLGAQSEED